MINNWKLGIKFLRYAHGIKINLIIGIIMLLLNIPVTIAGIMSENQLMGGYMLMCVSMLATQMLYSLSASNMVLTTTYRKKLQTSIPAALTCGNMMLMYLINVLINGILALTQGTVRDSAGTELIILALMMVLIMVYMGSAYKYFTVSSLFLCLLLPVFMNLGLSGMSRMNRIGNPFGHGGMAFMSAAFCGLAMLAAGGLLQYMLSLLVYRAPLSKMAQAAPLRKEL